MPKAREERINTAIEKAELTFWASIAESFPEAKFGDLSPLMTVHVSEAMKKAVKEWVDNNA